MSRRRWDALCRFLNRHKWLCPDRPYYRLMDHAYPEAAGWRPLHMREDGIR